MADHLERTDIANSHFALVTGEIPIVVSNSAVYDMFQRDPMHDDDPAPDNPFDDDTPLECGLENPDICESCQ